MGRHSSFILIRKTCTWWHLLSSCLDEKGVASSTSIFIIENMYFLIQMAPQASWLPDVPAESLEARSPQPGNLSQESSARSPQQDSSARIPQPGISGQEASARIPQPGVFSQDSSARSPHQRLLSQDSSARSLQPNCLGSHAGVIET